jgi:predicted kinase
VESRPEARHAAPRASAVARLRECLGWAGPPPPGSRPALIILAGLPGSGKSHLAEAIARQHPAAIVRSDQVRKLLFPQPQYTGAESGIVYLTCYALIEELLADGYTVVFDATNLTRESRRRARACAERRGVPSLTLIAIAPEEVIEQRLRQRHAGGAEPYFSDATWEVHRRLARRAELSLSPSEPGVIVDTSRDLERALAVVDRLLSSAPERISPVPHSFPQQGPAA